MITFIYLANDWVQHGARYRGGGDVLKKNAREARSVTLSHTSPALWLGPSARSVAVNFFQRKVFGRAVSLKFTIDECDLPLLRAPIVVAANHHVLPLLWPSIIVTSTIVAVHHCDSHYCGLSPLWLPSTEGCHFG